MSNSPIEDGTRFASGAEGNLAAVAVDDQTVIAAGKPEVAPPTCEVRRKKADGEEFFVRGYDAVGGKEIGEDLAVDFNGRLCKVLNQDRNGPGTTSQLLAQKKPQDKARECLNVRLKEVKDKLKPALIYAFYDFVSKYLSGKVDINKKTAEMMAEKNGFMINLGSPSLGIGGRSGKGISVMPNQQDSFAARENFADEICKYAMRIANELLAKSDLKNVKGLIGGEAASTVNPADVNFDVEIDESVMKIFFVYPQTSDKPSATASATPPTPGV